MGQDEGMYQQYIPLALHLAEDCFLQHPSKDVQLLIACCIADVLRVYAPEAPYKDPDQVHFVFILESLFLKLKNHCCNYLSSILNIF